MMETLSNRLGGVDGITQLVSDAVDEHPSNPLVKTRFENAQDIDHAKLMSVEFFSVGYGRPGTYSGKDMLTAHKGMDISEQEYMAVMDDIMAAMGKNGIGEDEKKDVLAILYSLKSEIIRV